MGVNAAADAVAGADAVASVVAGVVAVGGVVSVAVVAVVAVEVVVGVELPVALRAMSGRICLASVSLRSLCIRVLPDKFSCQTVRVMCP